MAVHGGRLKVQIKVMTAAVVECRQLTKQDGNVCCSLTAADRLQAVIEKLIINAWNL